MESKEGKTLEEEALKRQEILDAAWRIQRPRQRYINGYPVSEEEYWEYMEERKIEDAKDKALLDFYRKCTSTGEEWEIDSDGLEYIP